MKNFIPQHKLKDMATELTTICLATKEMDDAAASEHKREGKSYQRLFTLTRHNTNTLGALDHFDHQRRPTNKIN